MMGVKLSIITKVNLIIVIEKEIKRIFELIFLCKIKKPTVKKKKFRIILIIIKIL
jgi:hypothetical protein